MQGINPSVEKQKLKIQALEEEVNGCHYTIPFFALTETHLNESILEAEVCIKNYNIIKKRPRRIEG